MKLPRCALVFIVGIVLGMYITMSGLGMIWDLIWYLLGAGALATGGWFANKRWSSR